MAFAATTRVRHTGRGQRRPRRRWLMSTERHPQVANSATTPSEVDDAVGFPPVGRWVNDAAAPL